MKVHSEWHPCPLQVWQILHENQMWA
jgi:hypothetical protein